MARKEIKVAPYVFPLPVLIIGTYDKDDVPNAMNAAWGGVIEQNKIIISFSEHKTTDNIQLHKAFTVAMGDAEHVVACDYVGIVSAKKVPNKLERAGFSVTKSEKVHAPIINELPLSLECKLDKIIDGGYYVGEIVGVSVDERILDKDGKIDLDKFHPIALDASKAGYHELGKKVGQAFFDGLKLK